MPQKKRHTSCYLFDPNPSLPLTDSPASECCVNKRNKESNSCVHLHISRINKMIISIVALRAKTYVVNRYGADIELFVLESLLCRSFLTAY